MNYSSLPNPENIRRRVLPNGMVVLAKENDQSAAVSLRGVFPAGAYLDPAGAAGLSKMTSSSLLFGNEKRGFDEINELLDDCAASLNFNSGARNVSFDAHCLSEDLPTMLELVHDSLTTPTFPAELLDIVRRQAATSYEVQRHDPDSMADEVFNKILYPDHPYGRPDIESIEALMALTRDDVAGFAERYYSPKGMILAVSGGADPEQTLDLTERIFGAWDPEKALPDPDAVFAAIKPYTPQRIHHEIPGKSEMSLVVGVRGPKYDDPLKNAAKVGNSILGEFGMMGRVGHSVRDEYGLAYSVDSSLSIYHYGGDWSVAAGVNPEDAGRALDLILAELKRFTTEEVSDEELDDVKSFLIGGMPLGLSSNESVAHVLINIEHNQLGLDHFVRFPEKINAITKADVLQAAQTYWDPDQLVIVTAGTAA